MATEDVIEFECMSCGVMFNRTWFEVSRGFERVHFNSPAALDEVETSLSENLSAACSRACHSTTRLAVMREQAVPIPTVRPSIGPVEACARCSGPVDMSDWHLTFGDAKMEEEGWGAETLEFDYLAVVCKKCEPFPRAAGVEVVENSSAGSQPVGTAAIPLSRRA